MSAFLKSAIGFVLACLFFGWLTDYADSTGLQVMLIGLTAAAACGAVFSIVGFILNRLFSTYPD